MDGIECRSVRCYPDERGELYVQECMKDLPFVVRRVYYITNVADADTVRGFHAHIDLQQVMFCVGGSCEVIFDDGKTRETVLLDHPGKSVYVKPGIWREMKSFSRHATLIVLASEVYDEADYIRDYDRFIDYINSKVN